MNQSVTESYLPTSIDDMVLAPATQERLLAFRQYLDQPKPTAWLFHGAPGLGKTTLARLTVAHFKHKLGAVAVEEVGSRVCDEVVEAWRSQFCEPNLFSNQIKIVWIDEADSMTRKAKEGLRTVIQVSFLYNTHWILTANALPAKFGPALKSRLQSIAFSDHGLAPLIEKRLVSISEREGCPIPATEALPIVRNNKNDIRASLNELDREITSIRFRSKASILC